MGSKRRVLDAADGAGVLRRDAQARRTGRRRRTGGRPPPAVRPPPKPLALEGPRARRQGHAADERGRRRVRRPPVANALAGLELDVARARSRCCRSTRRASPLVVTPSTRKASFRKSGRSPSGVLNSAVPPVDEAVERAAAAALDRHTDADVEVRAQAAANLAGRAPGPRRRSGSGGPRAPRPGRPASRRTSWPRGPTRCSAHAPCGVVCGERAGRVRRGWASRCASRISAGPRGRSAGQAGRSDGGAARRARRRARCFKVGGGGAAARSTHHSRNLSGRPALTT